jgi:antitoxin MazE
MQTVVKKWGNSLALRLPQHIATDLNIMDGATVDLEIDDHSLIVRPARKKYKLADLLAQMKDEHKRGEVDWGEPKGDEVW